MITNEFVEWIKFNPYVHKQFSNCGLKSCGLRLTGHAGEWIGGSRTERRPRHFCCGEILIR